MRLRTRTRTRERGSVGIVLVAFLLAMTAGGVMVVTYASQDERSAEARTAADSAALAGALVGRDDLIRRLLDFPPEFPTGTCSQLGRDRAASYAEQNGGTLTDYCFDLAKARAEVTVRVAREGTGGYDYQRAAAQPRVLPSCREFTYTPSPTPTPTPTPPPSRSPSPPEPPEPPEPVTELRCELGGYSFDGDNGLHLGLLKQLLEPELTSVDGF